MTATDDHTPVPYLGEIVDAEIVDDDEPHPHPHDDPTTTPRARSRRLAVAAATVARHTAPGFRHMCVIAVHWTTAAYMSDEEIYRRIVKRQLDAHTRTREEKAEEIQSTHRALDRLAKKAADGTLADPTRAKTRALELARTMSNRKAELAALAAVSFETTARRPTPAQVARARSLRAARRFLVTLCGVVTFGGIVYTAPAVLLAAAPITLAGAWWFGRHPLALGERPLPEALDRPELASGPPPVALGQTPDPTGTQQTYDPDLVTPETEELTRALYGVRLLKAPRTTDDTTTPVVHPHATRVGDVHRDHLGWTVIVVLPAGQDVNADKVIDKRIQIAGEMAVDESLLLLERVKPGEGGHARMLRVSRFHTDPFGIAHRSPLIGRTDPLDVWNGGAPVASGPRGDLVCIPLRDVALLIGGASRTGKGVAIAALVCAAALDPRVNVRIVDGKGSGEHNRSARIAATFFKHSPERLLALLLVAKDEMDRRYGRLADLGRSKLDGDLLHEMPIELIVVDELYPYTTHPKLGAKILRLLILLGSQGLGAGIILVLATQTPMVAVVPRLLRNNVGGRWAMRMEDATSSNTILGDGKAGQGFDSSKISDETRGVGWLGLGGTPVKARSHYLTDAEVADIIAQAHALREAASRLPGQWDDPLEAALVTRTSVSTAGGGPGGRGDAGGGTYAHDDTDDDTNEADDFDPYAGDDDEGPDDEKLAVLVLILALYDGEARAHQADIAARLNDDGTHGTGWNSNSVGGLLRAAGIEPKSVRVGGKSAKGVDLLELRLALTDDHA
ncbi:FtsK/SpoIIIE domain-containing protein [Streptomyces hydrogenans]|uniref:FtsK/SpoIIIE domain-containing protein n=1 Tax=Streptomyces hydrogenans TaxID=1873719 RepID=UPI0038183334